MAIPSANTQKHLFLSSAGNLSAYFTMAAPLVSKIQVKLGGMDPICSLLSAWLGFSSDLRCHFSLNLLLLWDGLDSPSTSTFCLPLLQFPDSLKHLLHRAALLVLISLQWPGAPTPGPWVQCKYPDRLITNQSMRATKCNPKKRFLEGASVSSGWLQPWKTPQCGRRCRVQVADAVPKDPSELLQLLRWNSFMFRHWLALPNISNVIYIPQKRSRTLQVKPNHKPSQSLHLRKMFIFSSCRLRGARQQIWPAAAHHTNTVSTNGRLAVKTLNTALSDLSNAFLIRKETNPGTRGDPDLEETPVHPLGKDLARTALAAAAIFLLGNPIRAHFWIVCLLFCKGSRCLTRALITNFSQEFTGGKRKTKQNAAKVHMQLIPTDLSPYSSLGCNETPWVHHWDAVPEQHVLLDTWARPKLAWPSPPAKDAERGGKEQARWGIEGHAASLSALLGHAMALGRDWGDPRCGRARQDRGDSVSLWEWSSGKRGRKRQGAGEPACSGLRQRGEGRQDPTALIHPVSVQLRHPEPAPVSPYLRPEVGRHKLSWKQDLGSSPSRMQDLALHLTQTQLSWPRSNPSKVWKASHRSRGLSQPSQCSHQLSSRRGSGTVTSRSLSKSVMERWNIWFQVTERLSAALSFFFFPTSLPDYSQLNLNGEQFHRWNKYEARLHATSLPLLPWLSEVFLILLCWLTINVQPWQRVAGGEAPPMALVLDAGLPECQEDSWSEG